MHLVCHVFPHVISHASSPAPVRPRGSRLLLVHPPASHCPARGPSLRGRSHLGSSPGKETLTNWPTLGTGTCLPVEQDKHERVFARVGPQDTGEKERGGLTGEGKKPRQGTREAVSVDRQKPVLRTPLPGKSPPLLLSESTFYPQRRTEVARMVTTLGQSAPALHSKASFSSLPNLGAAEPNNQTGPPLCMPRTWLCRPSLHFAASPTDAPSIF